MQKTIFTLNIDNYAPEITKITHPFIAMYAKKIGADFHIISKRKFPTFPITYEKMQIFTSPSDWNIYIDSDALIHPDTFDITEVLPLDTVLTCKADFAPIRWRYDKYFRRDGRHIGGGNWFTVASSWCLDLWHPLDDLSIDEALANIFPTIIERNSSEKKDHFIDDYVISRNIAKYGLKYTTFVELLAKHNNPGEFLFHEYLDTTEEKVKNLQKVLNMWRGLPS